MQLIRYILTSLTATVFLNPWMMAAKLDAGIPGSEVAAVMTVATSDTSGEAESYQIAGIPKRSSSPACLTAKNGTYYLTMTLPNRAGKQFARVSFTDPNLGNGTVPVQFNLSKTQAFVGTPSAMGRAIRLDSAWIDETGTIWVEFNPSLPAATTLTVALNVRNLPPRASQGYGIAAYPTNNSAPLFVGDATRSCASS